VISLALKMKCFPRIRVVSNGKAKGNGKRVSCNG